MDSFNFNSRMNSPSYYGNRNSDSYPDFEGVQDLSYSAAEHQNITAHDDQACIDLSLLLSSSTSKDCDRQQIEDELPLNLTGKAREEEINRRLKQRQQYNNTYSYSYPFCYPPRSSQVFVAPDYLGMHELQDLSLRTNSYMDDATSLNLSYCPQTLDLSAQSLDLSLNGQDLSYDNSIVDLSAGPHNLNLDDCDIINLTCHGDSETNQSMLDLALLHQQQHPLPPASSLPLPLSITQSLTPTSCSNHQQYTALDLQKNSCVSISVQQPTVVEALPSSSTVSTQTSVVQEKKYMCAQCGECFITTDELTTHREGHSASKPFECDQCGVRLFLYVLFQGLPNKSPIIFFAIRYVS